MTGVSNKQYSRSSWLLAGAALLILDVSLSFSSLWPTPGIKWTGQLSVECALLVAGLAAAWHLRGAPPRWLLGALAALWTVLTLGRYAAVTSTALFGRDVNLYWDSRHLSAVAAMLARVATPLEIAGVVLSTIAVPLAVYVVMRWAVGRLSAVMAHTTARRWLAGAGVAVIAAFALERALMQPDATPILPAPVASTYLRQAGMVADVLLGRGADALGEGPALTSNLAAVNDADIVLVFLESYGAVTYDRPDFKRALDGRRAQLQRQARDHGLGVASAFVESPTFGGSSWLAHVSFITGIEVKNEGTNVRLMAQKRHTLVTALKEHGYRAVAVMPGLQEYWPEGAFYEFDRIYDTQQLAYAGPSFGWWPIPDQFALAQLERLELGRPGRAPLFAFFPTTSTHTPFSPTPPYQPSWARMLTATPYDESEYQKAWAEPPDWLNLGPSYVRAIDYALATLGGFVSQPRTRDLVLIVIGDHQPPAVVSGEGAPWDVPVHVISSRPALLDALRTRGFSDGVNPSRMPLMRLHELMPALVAAMNGPEAAHTAARSGSD